MRVRTIGRDALTGQFIPVRLARQRWDTAVVETYPVPARRTSRRRPVRAGSAGKSKTVRKGR
jgi:hypothetical protein